MRSIVNLKHGVSVASSATIDLSTPDKADKGEDFSMNTAETTPQSASSSSAKRRNRVVRMRNGATTVRSPTMAEKKVDVTPKEESKNASFKKAKTTKEAVSRPVTVADSINSIVLKIVYETVPGQDLYILGQDEKFGAWDTLKLGLPLKWTTGHVWQVKLSPNSLPKESVFKFIVSEIDGSLTWETRSDRVFDISKITNTLTTSNRLKSKGFVNLEKGAVKMEFEETSGTVTLTYIWNQ